MARTTAHRYVALNSCDVCNSHVLNIIIITYYINYIILLTFFEIALDFINILITTSFPDEQPFIEAFPASVTYTVNLDTNFEDREAFVTGFSKYLEEATVQSDMVIKELGFGVGSPPPYRVRSPLPYGPCTKGRALPGLKRLD